MPDTGAARFSTGVSPFWVSTASHSSLSSEFDDDIMLFFAPFCVLRKICNSEFDESEVMFFDP